MLLAELFQILTDTVTIFDKSNLTNKCFYYWDFESLLHPAAAVENAKIFYFIKCDTTEGLLILRVEAEESKQARVTIVTHKLSNQ